MIPTAASSLVLVPADPAEARINHFNGIRLTMALAVIWSHSFALYLGSEAREPVSFLFAGFHNAGSLAVRVFFIVSGFLIAQSWHASRSPADYFAKRARRIYPGFIAATALCSLVVVPLYATAGFGLVTPHAVLDWAWRAITLDGRIPGADAFAGNPNPAVNGALWSIKFEAWCYVGLAVLGLLGLLRRPWMVLAAMLGAIAGKGLLDIVGKQPGGGLVEAVFGWPYAWLSLAPCFLGGVLVWFCGALVPRSAWLLALLLGALVASAQFGEGSRIAFDILFPFAITYAVFYVAYSRIRLPDAARFGDFSYGVYLYGFPIQQMLKASIHLPFAAYVVTCLALSLLAGVASWNLVEKWFVGKPKPRALRERAPAPGMQPA